MELFGVRLFFDVAPNGVWTGTGQADVECSFLQHVCQRGGEGERAIDLDPCRGRLATLIVPFVREDRRRPGQSDRERRL
jgi:hypothetical protein